MITLRVDRPGDLLALRFATSPVWETSQAVRSLARRASPHQRPWLATVSEVVRSLDLGPLLAVNPPRGYTPDFLTPPPMSATPRFADQLAQIRATPPEQARTELERCRAGLSAPADREAVDELLADPAAVAVLAEHLERVWRAILEPYWPRVSELLRADIVHRSQALAGRGLGRVLEQLDPAVRWTGTAIVIERPGPDEDVEPDPRGIILMPSAYTWPTVVVVTDRPWQPTIVYPARGIGRLWRAPEPAPAALARLLGPTRAAILIALESPTSTTALAARFAMSPSGASRHLVALREAGLLASTRHRHEVRYARTRLGAALVRASSLPHRPVA